ncbi:T9SS type A sorting domain-containing protein [Algibacter sp.]|nr:T9SS type A sorting domain-containing protein [Algibacter sp.]
MKFAISISFFVFGLFGAFAQISNVQEEFPLPLSLNESSGIIYFNGKLITHNDSGGNNELYEVDLGTEAVTRTVTISGATNIDWEDMTQDDTSIYIGDIGNNISGNRADLKIYKISKSDFLSMDTVTAETISFSYSDQTDFTATSANNTEWDAEALVSYDASNLILFTKNWINGITKGYLVSKTPGMYSLTALATTLNSNGLITGGTYNPFTAKLFLVGYNNTLQPFVWECENFTGSNVFSGTNTQTQLSSLVQEQVEAITFVDENSYLITSESFLITLGPFTASGDAKLISFSTNDVALSMDDEYKTHDLSLFPNPVEDVLHIKGSEIASVQVYDTKQVKLYDGNNFLIDTSPLSSGIYFVNVRFNNHTSVIKKIIKK